MENLRKMGTSELVEIVNETGGWSNRNYTSGRDDKLSEHLDGFAIKEKLWDGGSRRRPGRAVPALQPDMRDSYPVVPRIHSLLLCQCLRLFIFFWSFEL